MAVTRTGSFLFFKIVTCSLLTVGAGVFVLEASPRWQPPRGPRELARVAHLLRPVHEKPTLLAEVKVEETPSTRTPEQRHRTEADRKGTSRADVFGKPAVRKKAMAGALFNDLEAGKGHLKVAMGGMHLIGSGDSHGIGGPGARGRGAGRAHANGFGLPGVGGAHGVAAIRPSALGTHRPPQRRVHGQADLSETPDYGRVESNRSGNRFRDWGLNGFVDPARDPESTFAVDVDTTSYTLVRRMLNEAVRPPPEAVRPEELINYFDYGYREPSSGALAVHLEAAPSPFDKRTHLLKIGVQARRIPPADRKPTHLTFLVDVSGSMRSEDRLPLAQKALAILVSNLQPGDTVALVTYADEVRRVLSHTPIEQGPRIHAAIAELTAGGATAMGSGIELAYDEAGTMLRPGHISRVVVLSDGDTNIGATTHEELLRSIEGQVRRGVTLTTVGFGMGNFRDELMEQLANRGNGTSYYVDSPAEAQRIFQDRLAGTLEVVAKDVKLQVVFDPRQVRRYRLVGYENRDVADDQFRDDAGDGGEIGAGHSVTALYEVELRKGAGAGLARVHVRAKRPDGARAEEAVFPFEAAALHRRFDDASAGFRFATAVMAFSERLRGSLWAARWPLARAHAIARAASSENGAPAAERVELAGLVRRLDSLELGRAVD